MRTPPSPGKGQCCGVFQTTKYQRSAPTLTLRPLHAPGLRDRIRSRSAPRMRGAIQARPAPPHPDPPGPVPQRGRPVLHLCAAPATPTPRRHTSTSLSSQRCGSRHADEPSETRAAPEAEAGGGRRSGRGDGVYAHSARGQRDSRGGPSLQLLAFSLP